MRIFFAVMLALLYLTVAPFIILIYGSIEAYKLYKHILDSIEEYDKGDSE